MESSEKITRGSQYAQEAMSCCDNRSSQHVEQAQKL